mgnify:CR=1 FL=1
MLKLNKILVPTDFSEAAHHAGSYARALAKKFGGTIDMIHVIPTIKYLNESIKKLGLPLDMDKDVYPKIVEEARKRRENEEPDRMERAGDPFYERVRDGFLYLAEKKSRFVTLEGTLPPKLIHQDIWQHISAMLR